MPPAKPAPTTPSAKKQPHRNERVPAAERPVAAVAVDVNRAHLDRTFDYQVPEQLAADAVPGARVRVRFAGRLVDGFVVERLDSSDHPGKLGRLELYGVMLVFWAVMLAWPAWWLARYRHGPLEWLWRCLTYGRRFPLRR